MKTYELVLPTTTFLFATAVALLTPQGPAKAASISYSINPISVHTYFAGTPQAISIQMQDAGLFNASPLELVDEVPYELMGTEFFSSLQKLAVGVWPGSASGLSETQTVFYSVTVGLETAVLSQDVRVQWIENNQAMMTVFPAAAVVLDLGPVGILTITPSQGISRTQFPEAGGGPGGSQGFRATFLLDEPPSVPVAADIKPGSCPNPIVCRSKGVIPVAILGTDDFDVMDIDIASVRLAGAMPLRSRFEDVGTPFEPFLGRDHADECTTDGADGHLDLALKFDTQAVIAAIESKLGDPVAHGDTLVLSVSGETVDGTPIVGEDVVRINCMGRE